MDQNKINNIIDSVSNKIGNTDALKKAAQSGDMSGVVKSLSPEQQAMFNRVLSDKKEAEKLLSTPEAIALMKLFSGK